MIEELHLFGVFVPAALMWAVMAAFLAFLVHRQTQRLPLERWLWQPGLFDLAVFLLLWWGLATLADRFYPRLIVR